MTSATLFVTIPKALILAPFFVLISEWNVVKQHRLNTIAPFAS